MTNPPTHALAPLRDLQFMASPALWPAWPYLPLVRRTRGELECGLLFDGEAACGLTGLRCTVILGNLLLLPPTLGQLLALPRDAFDSFEAVLAAAWRVD